EGEAIAPPDEPGPGAAPGTEPTAQETAVPPRQAAAREGAPARPAAAGAPRPARAATAPPAEGDAETVEAVPAAAAAPTARVDERIVERYERERTGASDQYTRRRILRTGFFGTMGLLLAAFALSTWNFLWPRKLAGFGGIF